MKNLILFCVGGAAYILIEFLYRGYSHSSMFILGGICFLLIGLLNEYWFSWEMALTSQMLLSMLGVSCSELAAGLVLNGYLNLDVWSYADQLYNLYGQICLLYSCYWFLLSLPAILLDDLLREKWFKEDRKTYKIL